MRRLSSIRKRIEQIMIDTCDSTGHRMEQMMSALDLNFGDAESFNYGLRAEICRDLMGKFRYEPEESLTQHEKDLISAVRERLKRDLTKPNGRKLRLEDLG